MKRIITTVAARVILAAAFAILIAAMKWEYFQWGIIRIRFVNTFFYPASIVFVVVLLLSALLHPIRELYRNGRIPLFQSTINRLMESMRGLFSRLSFQFAFWGLIMGLLMIFTWNLELLQDNEYRFNQTVMPWVDVNKAKEDSPVVLFNYISRDNNTSVYLRNCLKIATDLKEVGAKAVLVPLPFFFPPQEWKKLSGDMQRTGIVVFGIRTPNHAMLAWARKTFGARTGSLTMDIYGRNPFRRSLIQRTAPLHYEKSGLWQDAHDVTFELLRLYYNLPAENELVREEDHLIFGSQRFPVNQSGVMNVGSLSECDHSVRVNAGYDVDWGMGFKGLEKKPKVEYFYPVGIGKFERTDNLVQHRQLFEGKIVIVQWADLGGLGPPYGFSEFRDYAQVIDNILRGNVLTQSNSGSLLIGLVSILGCGLILYRSRLVSAVALLVLFSFVVLYGSAWLFQEMKILVDIPVAIASLIVSTSVFTVLRLGYEWRFGTSRGYSLPAASTPERAVIAVPGTSGTWGFSRRKISISPAVAAGVLLLLVAASVVVVRELNGRSPGHAEKETVYITSLPTVDVRGAYIPTKEAKQ